MRFPLWFPQVFLVMLMVQVCIAFGTGKSPVIALLGIILVTTNILVRQYITKAK